MPLFRNVRRYISQILQKEQKPILCIPLFSLMSTLFSFVIWLRNFAYDRGFCKVYRLPTFVISIGNIAVGGTGKTPLVQKLAKQLSKKMDLAVLTRGFLSQIESSGEVEKISEGVGCSLPVQYCGDEPYLLANTISVPIWVGRNRVESGYRALAEKRQCLLLDDGMQYRSLARDMEIVVIDAKDPFGRQKFLPSGLLRDNPKRLHQADWIVANHVDSTEEYKKLQQELSAYSLAPVIGMKLAVCNVEEARGKKVGVFCALGRPERFLRTVREIGCTIIDFLFLPDHMPFTAEELKLFATICRDKTAEILLCTEKDWVKLPSFRSCIPVIALRVELEIVEGHAIWQQMLEQISVNFSKKGCK